MSIQSIPAFQIKLSNHRNQTSPRSEFRAVLKGTFIWFASVLILCSLALNVILSLEIRERNFPAPSTTSIAEAPKINITTIETPILEKAAMPVKSAAPPEPILPSQPKTMAKRFTIDCKAGNRPDTLHIKIVGKVDDPKEKFNLFLTDTNLHSRLISELDKESFTNGYTEFAPEIHELKRGRLYMISVISNISGNTEGFNHFSY